MRIFTYWMILHDIELIDVKWLYISDTNLYIWLYVF